MKSLKMDLNVISLMVVLILCLNASLSLGRHHANATRCTEKERDALLTIKHDLLVDEYNDLSSWGSAQNQDCCRWERVYCNHQTNRVVHLHLRGISWRGTLSPKLSELLHLRYFDLSDNGFYEGINFHSGSQIPESIGSLTNLRYLDLSNATFSGGIPYGQLGNLTHLQYLNLGYNYFTLAMKNLNWLLRLSSLKYLDLTYTDLSEASDWLETINKLPNLKNLTLRFCDLPPPFLSTLSHTNSSNSLASVDLSGNLVNSSIIYKWLSNYNTTLVYLSLSSTEMSGLIPGAFRNMRSLAHLDLSHNLIRGWSTDVFANMSSLEVLSLSYNPLERGISKPLGQLCSLRYLYFWDCGLHIKFSEFIQILSPCAQNSLQSLQLSENDLFGSIPNLTNFLSLEELVLSRNHLSGVIPESIGLCGNKLSGTLPQSIGQLSSLQTLDLSYNRLSGALPQSIGRLSSLQTLDLSSNQLSGTLPQSIWRLSYIDRLDLSHNEIRGTIEYSKSDVASFYAEEVQFSSNQLEGPIPSFLSNARYLDLSNNKFSQMTSFLCDSKNIADVKFLNLSNNNVSGGLPDCWGLVKSIDLSSNRITGEIPIEITRLIGLVSLNISRNHLVGQIPREIGKLQSLVSLDLSRNKIDGGIPTSLARIDRLAFLNLSYNNLSGEIPTGTQLQSFDSSFYAENPQLCGLPLKKCVQEDQQNISGGEEDSDELITQGFYISLELGFAVGFWAVLGSLIFKRSWRYAYYRFLNATNDWLYVKVALLRLQLKRYSTPSS